MTKKTRARDTAIVELARQGATYADIGRQHGMSKQRVHQIIGLVEKQPNDDLYNVLRDRRVKSLHKIIVPLINAGFTRAEIIKHGVTGGDWMFMETHVPEIFKDHQQHIVRKQFGLSEDQLEQLAAPFSVAVANLQKKI